MTDYTSDQLKDLLCHLVTEGLRQDQQRLSQKLSKPDRGIFKHFGLLSAPHIACALNACGITAQAVQRRLVTATGWDNDKPLGMQNVFSDIPTKVEVTTLHDLVFSPENASFSTWENITTNPIFLAIQTRERAGGLACRWVADPPATQQSHGFSTDHMATLVEIITAWQAGVQNDVLAREVNPTGALDGSKASSFKM